MKGMNQMGGQRHVPLALLVTVFLHCATAVWWVSGRARDAVFLERRVGQVEEILGQRRRSEELVIERLARIEERVNAQLLLLDRIEKQFLQARRGGGRE